MWSYIEWSVDNPTFTGNPFDVIADVTFTHTVSGETRTTQMFYDGGTTWRFRFTGTRVGEWTFTSSSADPELDGLAGIVTINPNPDPSARGFLLTSGNRFVLQIGNDGLVQPYLFNAFMDLADPLPANELWEFADPLLYNALLDEAQGYGFDTVFTAVNNNWFELGALSYTDHASEDPDPATFQLLETMIQTAYNRGMRLHLWAWGDESRRWTPVGVGGINGVPDQRLQRYIAARLGPLPGWTLSYGFDLQEWVTTPQLNTWANYLHAHMGWRHLLFARGSSGAALDGLSYSSHPTQPGLQTSVEGPLDYNEVAADLDSDVTRPHFYEERFTYMRTMGSLDWTMERTRRSLWWYVMAGGVGSFWGHFETTPRPYPAPEQLQTFNQFWNGRFLIDYRRANSLTDGWAVRTPSNSNYVFYREDAASVQMNLSGMDGPHRAVAVDTQSAYVEIDLGTLNPENVTWIAPYASDWAIAIGDFDPIVPLPPPPRPRVNTTGGNSVATAPTLTPQLPSDSAPALALTMNANPGVALPGDTVQWAITIHNFGDVAAVDIRVDAVIPPELHILSTTADSATIIVNGQTVTFSLATLAPGTSATFYITTQIASDIPLPFIITNVATTPQGDRAEASVLSVTVLPRTGDSLWTQWRLPILALGMIGVGLIHRYLQTNRQAAAHR